ncbi:hypothetical protein L9F63_027173, partial [Diploptera punctata]
IFWIFLNYIHIFIPRETNLIYILVTPHQNTMDGGANGLPVPYPTGQDLLSCMLERLCNDTDLQSSGQKIIYKITNMTVAITITSFLINAKQLDWSERQVERWLRHRRSQDKPSTLTKFCETSWRWFYYTFSFSYGLICLWDKPWLWDINHSWYDYPHQSITADCWWYYMISLAFYWSLAVSQFFDVKRKDFWQMFIHHIATICLMAFSWICNLHRIGTLVLLIHDCADIFLEAAKMAKYASYQKVCDLLFVIFTILWITTRLGIYPMWIIYSTTIEAPKIVAMFPAYYIFNFLLILLLVLHLFWTYMILKIAFKFLAAGQMEGDIRSSSSEEVSNESNNGPNTSTSASPNSLHYRSNSNTGTEDGLSGEITVIKKRFGSRIDYLLSDISKFSNSDS